MVSLVEHGSDSSAPASTSWLLSGSVAFGLVSLAFLMRTLGDYDRLPALYEPVTRSVVVAAGVAMVVGWITPAPWVLALAILVLLTVNWLLAVRRMFKLPDPRVAIPNHYGGD